MIRKKGRTLNRRGLFILLAVVALALVTAYLVRDVAHMDWDDPWLKLKPESGFVGGHTEFVLEAGDEGSGLKEIQVTFSQEGREKPVLQKSFPRGSKASLPVTRVELPFTLEPKTLGFKDGKAFIKVTAWDRSWRNWFKGRSATLSREVVIDLMPLNLSFTGVSHLLKAGGAGTVAYRVNKPGAASGVALGDRFFPGYPVPGKTNGEHLALVALPREASGALKVDLVAREPGQEKRLPVTLTVAPHKWRQDSLKVSESFVTQKMAEFEAAGIQLSQKGDLLAAYLEINRKLRDQNHQKVREICAKAQPTRLWQGAFYRYLGKPMARYGDRRTYLWQGKPVDQQVHLGEDLADLEKTKVPAANAGVVAFAGYLGIYGNTVMVDHGWGVFSMYSHLSEIQVKTGDKVEKETILGRTGTTGLAAGDHLHFAMLVSGEFVNPVEWWDNHWLKDQLLLVAEGAAPKEAKAAPTTKKATKKPGKKAGSKAKKSKRPAR